MLMPVLLALAAWAPSATSDASVRTCEPIKVRMCKNIGYNATGMPNLARHTLQVDADVTLQTFNPLIQYGCSSQLPLFLCSVYVPMCTDKVALPIGPCRGLCESVHARCYPILRGFGFQWPSELDCSLFPAENNHEHMCMEGPGERDADPRDPPLETNPTGVNPACSKYAKSGSFVAVRGAGSGRCAQYCDAEVLHDSGQRRLAEVWLSTWAALSFACTLAAVAAWLLGGTGDACAGERALALMALCRCAAAAGWGVRAAAGRPAAGCARDSHSPQRLLLAHDGLANPNCAVVFLLLYYFGLAASVWWVVLAGAWRAGILRRDSPAPAHVTSPGAGTSRHSSLLQLAAWGVPAALTAAVLVTRDVDADELTGTCFVGNQSSKSLLALVIIPHAVCLLMGAIFLASGMRALLQRHPSPPPALLTAPRLEPARHQSLLRLGAFAVLYTVPSACILATWMYEYAWREDWLAAPVPSSEPVSRPRPAVWVFLFRIFVSQILGVITAIWVISPKAKTIWRRVTGRLGPQAYKAPSLKGSTIPGPPNTPLPSLSVHCYSTRSHSQQRPHGHNHGQAHKYATYSHQLASAGSYRKPRHHHYSAGETIL